MEKETWNIGIRKVLKPDVLVKGDDYSAGEIVGRGIVESYGGKVHLIPILKGFSTTNITQLILNTHSK